MAKRTRDPKYGMESVQCSGRHVLHAPRRRELPGAVEAVSCMANGEHMGFSANEIPVPGAIGAGCDSCASGTMAAVVVMMDHREKVGGVKHWNPSMSGMPHEPVVPTGAAKD